jgi:hypothetical protein
VVNDARGKSRPRREAQMKTNAASGHHHQKSSAWPLAGGVAPLRIVRHRDPASEEADDRVSLRTSVTIVVLSSLALWAVIWFALTCLITNWL